MDLAQEHEEFRTYVRGFLTQHGRASADESADEFDVKLWQRMAVELGLQGLGIPSDLGGSGGSWVELEITFEELGRALTRSPYLATAALAVPTLLLSGDIGAAEAWLPRIAAGECAATVAMPDAMTGLSSKAALVVEERDHTPRLSGEISSVVDGAGADLLIVSAKTSGDAESATLYQVHGNASGLTRSRLSAIDETLRFATVECVDTPAVALGRPGTANEIIEEVRDLACVAVAAEAVGGARACLEMALSYANIRTQFGRRIGSFQALKHRFADLAVAVESATGVAQRAAEVAASHGDGLTLVAALAKSYCCEVYTQAAAENIQLHGGIGFTWEHGAHLHYRRATALQNMFGSNGSHKDRVADLLGV